MRAAGLVCLNGVAYVHLLDLAHKAEHVPYMAALFIGLIASCAFLGLGLAYADRSQVPVFWALTGLLATTTIAGYALSRAVALPNMADHVGDWLNPLGLAAFALEATLVVLSVTALRAASRRTPRIPSWRHAILVLAVVVLCAIPVALLTTGSSTAAQHGDEPAAVLAGEQGNMALGMHAAPTVSVREPLRAPKWLTSLALGAAALFAYSGASRLIRRSRTTA